ncbi:MULTISPECIES: hypothetical protein [Empedobacter]|uniref:Lipoprotein n=1 Tax=Empedobacter tilapiae TaxID=2491114 RepID=A0A4Z1BDN0_9FLAO|nr:hypothetical protein [Empedobacter tilapiae]TGN26794.1 hypothetical protein E4J94_10145 [Empedobacter tilapiae]
MKTIKRLSSLAFMGLLGLTTFSCLNTDDNDNIYTTDGFFVGTKIEVNMDSIQPVGKQTNVHVTFTTNNSCENFATFRELKESNDSVKNIGAYGTLTSGNNCIKETKSVTKTYKFTPKRTGKNTIRVWAGKDVVDPTKDIYIEKILDIKETK